MSCRGDRRNTAARAVTRTAVADPRGRTHRKRSRSALDYAHRQGVVHRDIKPENILLHDGQALVADFGIALACRRRRQRMTQTGLSLGTPQYMEPEQAMGEKSIDARSDVYALGAVTYEMLTGDAPFTGSTVQAIVAKVLSAEAERRRAAQDDSAACERRADVARQAAADRFATAAEFKDAINRSGYTGASTQASGASVRNAGSTRTVKQRALSAVPWHWPSRAGTSAWLATAPHGNVAASREPLRDALHS